ncbi:EAL domain-containing protein [Neiella marina]|uniref:EAL domain-containing protein n=1 Tax=Neiella holothuriorum TaxID=2870530 RepID=A0ABS7EJ46_9GAMM|nr:GGDEF domain-containing phosphodiesterase [Neiella holothuriorum]MBW8191903.1 EAL domain-containing protein [Neiella holothuriorum]
MRLERRVHYILLPFIVVIFLAGGLTSYGVLKERRYVQYEQLLRRDINSMHNEIGLELRSMKSYLSEILNSNEFVRFSIERDSQYQAFTLGAAAYGMIDRTVKGTNVVSIYLTDQQGRILLSRDDSGPFDEPALPEQLSGFTESALKFFNDSTKFDDLGLFFKPNPETFHYVLARSFSPRRLQHDVFGQAKSDYMVAMIIVNIESFNHYKYELIGDLGTDLQFSFDPVISNKPYAPQEVTMQVNDDSAIVATINTDYYTASVKVPESSIVKSLQDSKAHIIFFVVVASLISYVLLWLAIRQVIVKPINELASRVKQTDELDGSELKMMDGDDEVSELNNAYFQLLGSIQQIASFDSLTGLANRRSFEIWLERHLARQAQQQNKVALLFIDLDKFKWVNDHYGHAVGDRLLREFGARLREITRTSDMTAFVSHESIARLAGDEFAVVLSDVQGPEAACAVATRVIKLFESGFWVDGITHDVQASIGIAMMPEDGHDASTLLKHADVAMYQAKANGRNRYEFFTKEIAESIRQRDMIEVLLKDALSDKTFELAYMPIVDLDNGDIVGCEALLRCPSLQQQGIGPDVFIPIAESTGLIKKIDLRVIEQAFVDYLQLKSRGFEGYVAVNISAVELRNEKFVGQLCELLAHYRVPAHKIHLELTETRLISPDQDAVAVLEDLQQLGFQLVLDDFGTGYTAFNQLMHYPVSGLKIDRSFIGYCDNPQKVKMVEIILALANVYELNVVAEGVETQEQAAYLAEQGCQYGQGYLFSKPIPFDDFCQKLEPGKLAAG